MRGSSTNFSNVKRQCEMFAQELNVIKTPRGSYISPICLRNPDLQKRLKILVSGGTRFIDESKYYSCHRNVRKSVIKHVLTVWTNV